MIFRVSVLFVCLTTLVFAKIERPLSEDSDNAVAEQADVMPNNILIGVLEDVRFQMPCGWPDRDIPPMVPLHIEKLEQYVGSQGIIE
jgi:hypothetical protein